MRTVGVKEAKESLSECLKEAQEDEIVIVRHGQPVALLIGVEGKELEDIFWGTNEEIVTTIEQRRRKSQTVSHEEAKRLLGIRR